MLGSQTLTMDHAKTNASLTIRMKPKHERYEPSTEKKGQVEGEKDDDIMVFTSSMLSLESPADIVTANESVLKQNQLFN